VRGRRYLNNIVEQDHRAIKSRCRCMLGFKSVRTAAITLAGIELAHRIRKQQFSLGRNCQDKHSLKRQWDNALAGVETTDLEATKGLGRCSPANAPELNVRAKPAGGIVKRGRRIQSVRRPRTISYGGGLYMLVVPSGGPYWRYKYRLNGKQKTLALGIYPDVPLQRARVRHQAARRLLADGIDPSLRRHEIRRASVADIITAAKSHFGKGPAVSIGTRSG